MSQEYKAVLRALVDASAALQRVAETSGNADVRSFAYEANALVGKAMAKHVIANAPATVEVNS